MQFHDQFPGEEDACLRVGEGEGAGLGEVVDDGGGGVLQGAAEEQRVFLGPEPGDGEDRYDGQSDGDVLVLLHGLVEVGQVELGVLGEHGGPLQGLLSDHLGGEHLRGSKSYRGFRE